MFFDHSSESWQTFELLIFFPRGINTINIFIPSAIQSYWFEGEFTWAQSSSSWWFMKILWNLKDFSNFSWPGRFQWILWVKNQYFSKLRKWKIQRGTPLNADFRPISKKKCLSRLEGASRHTRTQIKSMTRRAYIRRYRRVIRRRRRANFPSWIYGQMWKIDMVFRSQLWFLTFVLRIHDFPHEIIE